MYLNQKSLWKKIEIPSTGNLYGDHIYSEKDETIDVRRQEHVEEIRTADGHVYRTNYIYYTHADVKLGDKLDGHLVVDSYDMRTLGGRNRLRRLKTT